MNLSLEKEEIERLLCENAERLLGGKWRTGDYSGIYSGVTLTNEPLPAPPSPPPTLALVNESNRTVEAV